MPLHPSLPSPFRVNIFLKTKVKPFRYLALFFALSSLQFAQPATAFCDLPSETAVKPQESTNSSEQSHQTFGHMGTFFNDVIHYFGTRYRFGGQTPSGFDCSGFVRFMIQLSASGRPAAGCGRTGRDQPTTAIGNRDQGNGPGQIAAG